MKHVYPAVFAKEEGMYNVSFPNFPECITFGENMADAIEMAQDVLCLHLYNLEERGECIPEPIDMDNISRANGEVVSLIACDTLEYKKFYGKQAVKKTVSIPAWLNTMAEESNINFSSVLQQGLKSQLNIE